MAIEPWLRVCPAVQYHAMLACLFSVPVSLAAVALAWRLHAATRLERSSEKTLLQGDTARQRDVTGLFHVTDVFLATDSCRAAFELLIDRQKCLAVVLSKQVSNKYIMAYIKRTC